MDIVDYSTTLQLEAEKVIQETNILSLFAPLGTCTFVGSYRYKLLYKPEIDLFVTSKTCDRTRSIRLTHTILDSMKFQSIRYSDYIDHAYGGGWKGIYWKLKYPQKTRIWVFHIWYTSEWPIKAIEVIPFMLRKLNELPHAREEILRRKKESFDRLSLTKKNTSVIYEEILGIQ